MPDVNKLKIVIDRDECIGDGACENEAPETFEMDDESKAVVKEPPGDSLEAIMEAAKACPTECIAITDTESGNKLYPEE